MRKKSKAGGRDKETEKAGESKGMQGERRERKCRIN